MLKHCLLTFTLAAVVSAVIPAVAQDTGSDNTQNTDQQSAPQPGYRGNRRSAFNPAMRTQMLAKRLNLTTDQQTKVQDILKSEQSQLENLRGNVQISPQEKHAKAMEIHKTSNDQIRALLKSDQQQKWDEMQKRREQRMEERRGETAPTGSAPPSAQQPQ